MTDDSQVLRPIAEFSNPPFKLWRHRGLDCAIYWGSMGFNGYVRLDDDSPARVEAAMYDIVARERASAAFEEYGSPLSEAVSKIHGSLGYDMFEEFCPELTYGPDEEGWLGFDTAHYVDYWPPEQIELLRSFEPDAWEKYHAMGDLIGWDMWPHSATLPSDQRRVWTMERLVAHTESLAEYLIAREIFNAPTIRKDSDAPTE